MKTPTQLKQVEVRIEITDGTEYNSPVIAKSERTTAVEADLTDHSAATALRTFLGKHADSVVSDAEAQISAEAHRQQLAAEPQEDADGDE